MTLLAGIRRRSSRRAASATIDLAAADVSLDPWPHYEALRRHGDVHFLARHGFWIVLGYDAVKWALREPQLFSNAPYEDVDAVLLAADPPRHAAVRRIIAQRFSPEALNRLSLVAEQRAPTLIRPELDVVGDYGLPLSRAVAAELIGFDEDSVTAILEAAERAASAPVPLAALITALDGIAPRARIYGTLLGDGRDGLEDAEARSLVRLLWLAATTTTERVITRCVLRLLQHDAVWERVNRDRTLLPRFIEEVMRLHPPEHMVPRLTTRAVRLGTVEIPAGATVQLCVSAANRDPDHFDDPAELKLDRPPKQHFAFGGGVHHCVGAALTRRVVRSAVGALVDRPSRPRPLPPLDSIRYFHTATALSPERLVIRL